jgi:hypothetical protein
MRAIVSSPPIDHLLAGALIALHEEVLSSAEPTVTAMGVELERKARAIGNRLVAPLWNSWFQLSRPLSRTDIDLAVELFLQRHRARTDWYRALIKPPAITIEWREQQPFIAPESVARWELAANFFDRDALLTFDLADKRLTDAENSAELRGLSNWRTLAWVSDHELREITGRGISDLHVHLGGVRIAQALWRDLMDGYEDSTQLRILGEAYAEDRFPTHDRSSPRNRIDRARDCWRKLVRCVTDNTGDPPDVPKAPDTWATWSSERLNFERLVLVRAWSNLLRSSAAGPDCELLKALHGYLGYKHEFHRIARQPLFESPPGLRYFDEQFFRRTQRARRAWTGSLGARWGYSPRRDFGPYADACMYLVESPHLRRLELRVAPGWKTAADAVRQFKFWDIISQEVERYLKQCGHPAVEIRFAVHFVRSRKGSTQRPEVETTETGRIMSDLDRSSALLRLALRQPKPEYRHIMSAVARIDVAGQERDTQIAHFIMHMRLLRGDAEMIQVLEGAGGGKKGHPCRRWLPTWLHLRESRAHLPSLSEPGLGMTAHAGEDCGDILDGVSQIGVAVDHLALRAGDSIGHGLALVAPHDGPSTATIRMLPRGSQLDSLCWLHEMLAQLGERLPDQFEVRSMIERLGRDIYGEALRERENPVRDARFDDFVWVWKHKMLPKKKDYDAASQLRQQMVRLEYEEDMVIRGREQQAEVDPARRRLDEAVDRVRKILLDRIKERRIVIEINPASNLRIWGADQLRESPAVELMRQTADGLLVCINTDNPGVFGSRIENEYALILQGLLEGGVSAGKARDLLERARAVGMELMHWPPRPQRPADLPPRRGVGYSTDLTEG